MTLDFPSSRGRCCCAVDNISVTSLFCLVQQLYKAWIHAEVRQVRMAIQFLQKRNGSFGCQFQSPRCIAECHVGENGTTKDLSILREELQRLFRFIDGTAALAQA